MDVPAWVRAAEHGSVLRVLVQPRSSKAAVVGVRGDAVLVRVRAAPVGGEANDAVRRLLASALDVPISWVELVRGTRSRGKEFQIRGLRPEDVAARLQVPRRGGLDSETT
jgi:uncharacterized protein (TIGR00251 family)